MSRTGPPAPADRVNPHAGEAAVFLDRWVRRTGLLPSFSAQQRLRRAGCVELAARAVPDAGGERLRRVAVWFVWFFALDDRDGHGGPGPFTDPFADPQAELLPCLPLDAGRTPPPRTARQRALAEVWRMTAPAMSLAWRQRFVADFRTFLDRRYGPYGPVTAPVPALGAAARGPLPGLVEYAARCEVPGNVRDLPSFRVVQAAAGDVLAGLHGLRVPGARTPRAAPDGDGHAHEARLEGFCSALAELRQGVAAGDFPVEDVAAVAAHAVALESWLAGHLAWALRGGPGPGPGGTARGPAHGRRLSLVEDAASPRGVFDVLRPRRPVPPPAPSTGGGTEALQGGRP
ncbi:hypothetical protein ACFP1Z_32375 [Streptomyces gamaensis]|uniref:Terpene synthase n=1 Tax=Streptomyces gamaensis TaxID=1763542 RepID=A0ABW0ZE57_9ACTN